MSTIKSSAENLTLNADGANNDVIIQSNGSTKITVDGQNSRVGIGTTSPQNPLEISGNTNYLMRLTQTGTNKHMLKTVGNGASLEFLCDGANNYVGLNSTTNGDDIRFQTNDGNERMRMLAAGGLTFNGDTVAANALDDYEEGSGTPVVKKGTTTLSLTNAASYHYVKIGSLVTYLFEFNITNLNSGSGAFTLALPYVMMTAGYATGALRIYNGEILGGETLTIHSGSSTLNFNRIRNGTSTVSISPTNGGYYFGSISYRTT